MKLAQLVPVFGQLFESWPDRFYVKDEALRFVFANRAALSAANVEDLSGKTDADLFRNPHAAEARAMDSRILAGAAASGFEGNEIETWADGHISFVRTCKQALREKNGTIIGIVGMTRELTYVERDEFLFQETATRVAAAAKNAGFYVHYLDNDEIWLDPVFSSNFPGQTLFKRFSRVHHRDKMQVARFLHAAKQLRLNQKSSGDFRYILPGRRRHTWMRGEAYRVRVGERDALIVTHHVIGSPNVGDLLSRDLLDHFPGFIFVKDEKYQFKFMNKKLLLTLKKKGMSDVKNETDESLGLNPAEIQEFRKGDDAVLDPNRPLPFISLNETLTPPEGKKLDLVTIKMPLDPEVFEPGVLKGKGQKHRLHVLGVSINVTEVWRDVREFGLIGAGLMTHAGAVIYLKDTELRYTNVNKEFCQLSGKAEADVLGHKAGDVWLHNLDLVPEMEEQDRSVLDGMTQRALIRVTNTPDGSTQLRSTSKFLLRDEKGMPWRILGISREIERLVDPQIRRFVQDFRKPERRLVTVIFCDIRRFSQLTVALSFNPSGLVELLERFYALLCRMAKKHGCYLHQFLGDGAMLLVGAFESAKDEREDARRAAAFGLELRSEFEQMAGQWQADREYELVRYRDIRLGIGIHQGEAFAGFFESDHRVQFTPIGDTVNLAQRLESVAGKGHGDVLVSLRVRDAINDSFQVGDRCVIKLPKEDDHICAYSVMCHARRNDGTNQDMKK